jgi:hypothetical protein
MGQIEKSSHSHPQGLLKKRIPMYSSLSSQEIHHHYMKYYNSGKPNIHYK